MLYKEVEVMNNLHEKLDQTLKDNEELKTQVDELKTKNAQLEQQITAVMLGMVDIYSKIDSMSTDTQS